MKNGQIFARKSTARGGLDLEYLDETSRRKISLRERENMDQQIGKKLKHFTGYVSKETLGQVHVGGFFHNHICINPDGTNTARPPSFPMRIGNCGSPNAGVSISQDFPRRQNARSSRTGSFFPCRRSSTTRWPALASIPIRFCIPR
jgi:hypothetical protein